MLKPKDMENKPEEETSDPNAPEGESNEEAPEVGTDDPNNTGDSNSEEGSATPEPVEGDEVDYKEEYEVEKEARLKAERAIEKIKKDHKKDPEAPPIDADQIQEIVRQEVGKAQMDKADDTVDTLLDDMTDNEDERKLIEFHYNHSLQKTGHSRGQIKKDLEKAFLLSNAKKLAREVREAKQALKSNKSISNTGIGSNKVKPNVTKNELSKEDETFLRNSLKSRGFSPDQIEVEISKQTI